MINRPRVFQPHQPKLPSHRKTLSEFKNMSICGTDPFYGKFKGANGTWELVEFKIRESWVGVEQVG